MEHIINLKELNNKNREDFIIYDLRDSVSFEYGHIPGALNISEADLIKNCNKLKKEVLLYSQNGEISENLINELSQKGVSFSIISSGYLGWLNFQFMNANKDEVCEKAELSIRKTYHKELFTKFAKAINTYDMIKPNDKIAVCISGGKDSMLMAKLFQELKRHNKFPFELVFLVMDPGYSKANRDMIEKNAELLNIPITVFESDIFTNVFNIESSPCYVCARMRRGYLYSKAKELGCNKIALGHHFDDVIETIVMGMFYGAQMQTMMPKLHSANFEGMELIRPMYLIREYDIKRWRDYNNLYFIQCACKFTETTANESSTQSAISSKRQKIKNLIKQLSSEDPQIADNIFKSVENVNLATIVAYKDKDGTKHHFLDDYDK